MAKEEIKQEEKAETPEAKQASESAEQAKATEAAKSAEEFAAEQNPEASREPEKPAASEEKPSEPDWKTLYAVTLADFDNYKKRAARDREETYRYAEADILKDVLPAVDNLQLALASAKTVDAESSPRQAENDTAFASFVKGVQLVYDTLLNSLKDHGAEPFDSVGKDLDTEKMEAIATLPHAEIPEGKVSIESKRGWMLKGKVLRAAQVVVSSGKPA